MKTLDEIKELKNTFIEKLQAMDYEAMPLTEVAKMLHQLSEFNKVMADIKACVQKEYDRLSIEIVPEMMDDQGVESMSVKDVGRLQLRSDIRCSVKADCKTTLLSWLKSNGHDSLIGESVHAATLKSFIKEAMTNDFAYPEACLNILPYSRATVVKSK